jgi:hypothetical protein
MVANQAISTTPPTNTTMAEATTSRSANFARLDDP